jgi:hypothetical protein
MNLLDHEFRKQDDPVVRSLLTDQASCHFQCLHQEIQLNKEKVRRKPNLWDAVQELQDCERERNKVL